ncbi:tRNA wybutosine-synthesizing protein [Stagonosporopsis vannaccii]|nr:tRNA wybutosine-synthesizing protein [Stagonosporopsis vannaccii]
MTQTNQLDGTVRENPHTFASPYHGTGESSINRHQRQCFIKRITAMVSRFEVRKQKILEQLDAPDEEYHDLSPKGSVDAPIRDLISEINRIDGLVTTSSCSGRISVFLEGRKANSDPSKTIGEGEELRAGPGGKGGGGTWLFISHDPVEVPGATSVSDLLSRFGLEDAAAGTSSVFSVHRRFIHLKFEPMILHVLCSSLDNAQKLLNSGMGAGFRESGAVSLGSSKTGEANPVVAIRSAGYSFDSIIGYQDDEGRNVAEISASHLSTLVCIANERFKINLDRIARFRSLLLESYQPVSVSTSSSKPDWEDAELRKQRKRAEGLARQRALQATSSEGKAPSEDTSIGVDDLGGMLP